MMKKTLRLSFTLLTPLALMACSSLGLESDPTYSDKQREEIYKNGSLISDKGGVDIIGGNDKKAEETGGIGVNGFLWRASLDTVSFMPIASADPFGGVIITDWYSSPETPSERTKLNIFIRGRDLRADGVRVSVFKQKRDDQGVWVDAPVAGSLSGTLENAILTKARQIRIAQKQVQQ